MGMIVGLADRKRGKKKAVGFKKRTRSVAGSALSLPGEIIRHVCFLRRIAAPRAGPSRRVFRGRVKKKNRQPGSDQVP